MRKIENLLEGSLVRAGIEQRVNSLRVIYEVKKIFLNMFGVNSRFTVVPKGVKEKILLIEVRDESEIQEIKNREEEILVELENKLKKTAVKRLRFLLR
ncbi:MAG: hypothetical protein WCW66_05030 [Patescibacteria group bacterium]